MNTNETTLSLIPALQAYGESLEKEFSLIPFERRRYLMSLSDYFSNKFLHQQTPKIIVICTHNSRRSHLGQLWLAVGADYYQLPAVKTYSGGTEATAFNPRAVATIKSIGFEVRQTAYHSPTNPIYNVRWSNQASSYQAFSKKYDDAPNPTKNFAAIMVCTEADADCPYVAGADFRLSLPYEDPKAFDETSQEREKYAERCRQIGRELFYALSQVKF
ncbi:MAG: hypothetical protein AAF960_02580 [Bacteroidota bacterium]